MLLLSCSSLPEDDGWIREIKLDGYRALAFKNAGKAQLRSRNNNDMSGRYPAIAKALAKMPDDSVIDCELVVLDEDGRPSFNLLQNYGNSTGPLIYFVFDVPVLAGRDLKGEPLEMRRGLLEKKVMPKLAEAPRSAAASCEVFPHDPTFAFARVPLQSPLPQRFEDDVIDLVEDAFADHMTVIHRPAAQHAVEVCDQLPCRISIFTDNCDTLGRVHTNDIYFE